MTFWQNSGFYVRAFICECISDSEVFPVLSHLLAQFFGSNYFRKFSVVTSFVQFYMQSLSLVDKIARISDLFASKYFLNDSIVRA